MFIGNLYFFSVGFFVFIGFALKMYCFLICLGKKLLNMMNNKNVENIFI